jgi:hypothetical protein
MDTYREEKPSDKVEFSVSALGYRKWDYLDKGKQIRNTQPSRNMP